MRVGDKNINEVNKNMRRRLAVVVATREDETKTETKMRANRYPEM